MKKYLSLFISFPFFFAIPGLSRINFEDEVKPLAQEIHIPVVPVLVEPDAPPKPKPDPVNPPGPTPVSSLSEDTWYVIESSVPLIVLSSPQGFVGVESDEGPRPMKVRGKFADGTGKTESRTFSSKYLYFVNALKPGTIELLVIPVGLSDETSIIRQSLVVMGQTPKPPPDPKPDVDPDPKPDVDPTPKPPTGFRVLLLFNENANREELITLNSVDMVSWLDANCTKENGKPDWRKFDRTSISKPDMLKEESQFWRDLWTELKDSVPEGNYVIAIADDKVHMAPISTVTATKDFLRKIKEGK